jgi:hypothetical protein
LDTWDGRPGVIPDGYDRERELNGRTLKHVADTIKSFSN